VDMYDECIRLMKLTRNPTLSISFLLDIASQYAMFQEFDTAITYAQGAWMMDRFDERARTLLSKWSEEFKWYFTAQVKGANCLQMKWRTRVWSRTYYYRYHKICVEKWEAKLRRRHFDMKTRAKLAYFAKSKWRGFFLYEERIATKIQVSAHMGLRTPRRGLHKDEFRSFEICKTMCRFLSAIQNRSEL